MQASGWYPVPKDGVELTLVSGMGVCAGALGVMVFAPAGLVLLSTATAGAGLAGMYRGWQAGTEEIDMANKIAPELIVSGTKAAAMAALYARVTKEMPHLRRAVVMSVSSIACDLILERLILREQLPSAREVTNKTIASIAANLLSPTLCGFMGIGRNLDDTLGSTILKSIVEGGMGGSIGQIFRNYLGKKQIFEGIQEAVIEGALRVAFTEVLSSAAKTSEDDLQKDDSNIDPKIKSLSNELYERCISQSMLRSKDLSGADRDPIPEETTHDGNLGNPRPGKEPRGDGSGSNPRGGRIDRDKRK